MKALLFIAMSVTIFFMTNPVLASSLFSVKLKGRDVNGTLIVPIKDRALANQAKNLVHLNVTLSNRTHLEVSFEAPDTLVTVRNIYRFEGTIKNKSAEMSGPSGTMNCRIFAEDVLCDFKPLSNQANYLVLERRLRFLLTPVRRTQNSELEIKNQLDVAKVFNAPNSSRSFIKFSRAKAGLRFF